jgi:sec-independent protein translocase protein TatA
MGDIGFEKILLILLIVLLLFGAKRLPEFGKSLGRGIREFKGSLSGVKDAINEPAAGPDRFAEGRQAAPVAPPTTESEPVKEPRRLIS